MSEPSISAQSLVRYIGARLPSERKSILRRQKDELAKKTVVPFYQQAVKGIRDHHRDTPETLDKMLQRLTRSLDEAQRELERAPEQDRNKIRNRITRLTNNIRVCADYKENFGDRVIKYKLRRCSGLIIAGVRVSGEFTLAGELADRGGTGPCAIVVDTHADLPEADDVKNQLELAYALAGGERGGIPMRGFQVWHASSGRIWRMRQHSTLRWKSVCDWCAYIAARWEQRGRAHRMVHVVAYDLKSPNDTGADYEHVIDAIKKQYPTWAHLEQSVWLVETTQDAGEVRETLKPFLNAKDVLFVSRLSGNWATWNAGDERNNWLHARASFEE